MTRLWSNLDPAAVVRNCPASEIEAILRDAVAEIVALRGGVEKHLEMLEHGYAPFVEDRLSENMCCNGHMCGCRGASVGEYLAHLLREDTGVTLAKPAPDEGEAA